MSHLILKLEKPPREIPKSPKISLILTLITPQKYHFSLKSFKFVINLQMYQQPVTAFVPSHIFTTAAKR